MSGEELNRFHISPIDGIMCMIHEHSILLHV